MGKSKMWVDFKTSNAGNVSLMIAIVLAVCGVCIGAAIDGAKLMSVYDRSSSVADAAALAGASASESGNAERMAVVRAYIEANAFKISPGVISGEPTIVFDDSKETVTVIVPTTVSLAFGGFLGARDKPVGATSAATYLKNSIDPVSIAFALDVSGSMQLNASGGGTKIDVVKRSTKSLFKAIENGTDNPVKLKKVLRSGMSAYNTDLVTSLPMSWGWDALESSVDLLSATGGTNSAPALANSYNQLLNDRSFRAANDPNFNRKRLKEYVIFMTDGDNNQPNFDIESMQLCFDMRAEGIEIYSVAFEAPEKGELLLVECASPDEGEEGPGFSNKDPSKCMNNGANGKGKALGHCSNRTTKNDHYFDADDAKAFEAAFKRIGEEIVRSNVRLK